MTLSEQVDLYPGDIVRDLSRPDTTLRVVSVFATPGGIAKVLTAGGVQIRCDRVERVA